MAGIISGLKEGFGEVVGAHAHAAGAVLDFVGLDGAAKAVDDWGDDVAADLGAAVGEKNLGESEDPKDLVHGDTEAIAQSAAHLRKFAAAFESTASGLSRMDSEHWQGKAADAFRAKFGQQPVAWRVTADACEAAAGALESLAGTIQWAQGQARQAIEEYRRAQQASKDAADAYDRQVADYNHSVDAYNRAAAAGQSPTAPTQPGAFRDPGADGRRHAAEVLLAARKQRVSAADQAERAIRAATTAAPKEPGFLDRAGMALADAPAEAAVGLLHFEGGLVKGAVDVVKFGRGLNPMDPYNLTHPAVYLDHVNSTVAGLVRTGNHPMELVTGLVGSGWGKDPAEAGGKLVFNIVSGIATGGGSEAGVVAERAAIAAAEKAAAKSAAQNAAVHTGESAAEQAAAQAAKNTAVESGEQAGRSAASSAAVPHTTPPTGPGGLPEGWTLQPAEARPGSGVHEPGTGVHEPPTVGQTPHGQAPAAEPAAAHAPEEAPSPHTPDGDPAAPGEEHPAESAAHSDTPGPDAEGGSGHADAADGGPGTADHEQGPPPAAAGPGADQAIRLDPHAALREMRDLEDMRAAQSEISQNARTFRDDYDIVEFGRTWNDDIAKLPESQREALQAYTYGSDQEINGALRGQHPATPECAAKVRELDKALAAHPVPEDVVVSRGTDLGHFRMSPEEMEGRTFTEQGYMSTSPGTDPPAAFRAKEAILHLRVPSGTPGAWVEEAGQMGSAERELLLGRGQRWRADRVIRTADGKIHIYGEVL